MVRYDTVQQIWEPLSVAEVGSLFATCPARWWLSGGWAIDHWLGGTTRWHGDIDVSTLRPDLAALLDALPRHLRAFGAAAGRLLPLARHGDGSEPHNIWVQDQRRDRWVLQLNLEEGDATTWRYRRDPRVTRPWPRAVVLVGGLPTGSPATQLLWKARDPRTREEHDLAVVLPALPDDERRWLRSAIGTAHPRVTVDVRSPARVIVWNAAGARLVDCSVKKIGFLSFGHWSASRHSRVRSGKDALLQSIELAVAAEEAGADGAYYRVHHFAQQLASPFPLLAAAAARTSRIELGTAVIDMRYENPLYMAEDAGAADLISGGRLQLGISRGSPEQVIDGFRYFGYAPPEGMSDADMAREHTRVFLEVLKGEGFARPNPRPMFANPPGLLRIEPHAPGLRDRIWWGAGSRATAEWTAEQGLNLMSSTLLTEDTGVPFHQLQAEQIQRFRDAWTAAGHTWEPRVSVSRSIFPIVSDIDRELFWHDQGSTDQVGSLDGGNARFGKTYAGEPDKLIAQLAEDEAIAAADTLLLTVPNQLGVEYNAHVVESVLTHLAPELGWR